MSIVVGAKPTGIDTIAQLHKHDHVRPNPSNPLVQIKRDRSLEAENRAREVAFNPRGLPSKGGKLTDINAPTPTKPSLPMPERLKNPGQSRQEGIGGGSSSGAVGSAVHSTRAVNAADSCTSACIFS